MASPSPQARGTGQAFASFVRNSGSGVWSLNACRGQVVHGDDGTTCIAATPPSGLDMSALSSWLRSGCGGPPPTRLGFAGFLWEASTGVLSAATGFRAGPAWYVGTSSRVVVVGTLLPQVLEALDGCVLDLPSLVRYADGALSPTRTVYADVCRVPRGYRLAMHLSRHLGTPADPDISAWFDTTPRRRHDMSSSVVETDMVLRALEGAVDAGVEGSGPVTTLMSGGLDSTVVSALAASAAPSGESVRAYCHVTAPGTADITATTVASDGPWAVAAASHVDGLDLELVQTPLTDSPIAVMRHLIDTARYPALVPANEVWLADVLGRLDRSPSRYTLTGGMGNAMFSYGLDRPLALVVSGELAAFAGWFRHERDKGRGHRSIVGSLVKPLRRAPRSTSLSPFLTVDAGTWVSSARRSGGRPRFAGASNSLRRRSWLTSGAVGGWGPVWPSLNPDRWWDDPFTDPEYFAVVAALPVASWLRGGKDRSLARRVASRLLPQSVAQRESLGGQGADLCERMALHEDEFREAIEDLRSVQASRAIADAASLDGAFTRTVRRLEDESDGSTSAGLAAHVWARGPARVLEVAETARRHEMRDGRWRC